MLDQTYSDSDSEADSSSDELSIVVKKNMKNIEENINLEDVDEDLDEDIEDEDDEDDFNNLTEQIKSKNIINYDDETRLDNETENENEDDDDNVDAIDNENVDENVDDNVDANDADNDIDHEEEEDEHDDKYLQKFSNNIGKNILLDFHPECKIHNYDEIKKMSQVTRDSFGIIIDPLHKTNSLLTKYEKAKILGQRAKQIETGSIPMVKIPETLFDCHIIAGMELKQKKIPFIIKRPIPGGCVEYWKVSDLENIDF
jgi:DNA-directed RNA polymerase subunit K/omega